MKVILFGATGMLGQAVLRESLLDPDITQVQSIGRNRTGLLDPKFNEVIVKDLLDYTSVEKELVGFDACFFCLGTSSAGKNEAEYTRITHDFTLAAAETLSRLNPQMTFVYISGEGADSSEKSKTMWARVRGKTENDLFRLPFKAVYVFRPGVIQPLHGIQSKTASYRLFYSVAKPLLPLFRFAFPGLISTTETVGRSMLSVAKKGAEKKILKARDFEKLS